MSPNKNYTAGRRKEWQTQRLLEAQGYTTLRAAGSHGPFDVVAIGRADIKLIQIKTGNPASITTLEEQNLELIRVPECAVKQAWLWDRGSRLPRVREYR